MSKRKNQKKHLKNPPANQQGADLPEKNLRAVSIENSLWSGPVPPPEVLEKYDNVVPGAANRILEMAEKQAAHRIHLEKTVVHEDSKRSYLGLIAGFILSATIIIGGIYLIAVGHDWAGVTLVGSNLVGLAGIFIYGNHSRRAERQQRFLEAVNRAP